MSIYKMENIFPITLNRRYMTAVPVSRPRFGRIQVVSEGREFQFKRHLRYRHG